MPHPLVLSSACVSGIVVLLFAGAWLGCAQTPTVTLVTGSSGKSITELGVFGSMLHFQGDCLGEGNGNIELCRYTGSGAITRAAYVDFGGQNGAPRFLTEFNSALYFSGFRGPASDHGRELHKYIGTSTSVEIADFVAGSGSSNPSFLVNYAGMYLYFAATNSGGTTSLYRYTGTGSTYSIRNLAGATTLITPTELYVALNRVFHACFVSGPGAGKICVESPAASASNSVTMFTTGSSVTPGAADFCLFGTRVYFKSHSAADGSELWYYESGTVTQYANIASGATSSTPAGMTVFNGNMYFSAASDGIDRELWMTNGVFAPSLVTNIDASGSSDPSKFLAYNNR
jgi:ELWxxDGT repeat protein